MNDDTKNNETATERRQREEYEKAQLEKQELANTQAITTEQRQNEEWERAQKPKDTHDNQHQPEEVVIVGKSINKKVVSQFWLDGLLRVITLLVLFFIGKATLITEFWSYSPFKLDRAENVVVCWPIHFFDENDNYPGYDGQFSYLQKESLPPDIVEDYDVINKKIMALINDEQSELHVKIKWGAYPVIDARKEMKIIFMASDKETVCRCDYRETQMILLK